MRNFPFLKIAPLWSVSFICICVMLVFCTKGIESKPIGLAPSSYKPKIGIAFGGGGAKAAAQIGVVKRLEELGIKPSYVAGTSMGSVIAALYAAGYTSAELERLLVEDRDLWIYYKKKVLSLRPFDGRKITGVITTKAFQNHLEELLQKKGVREYDDYNKKIPFQCVVTEFKLSELTEKICSIGGVARDVASSAAFPVAFMPIHNKQTQLVDGGMMNNLPVDVVENMGADIVIAIDLESGNNYDIQEWLELGSDLLDNLTYGISKHLSVTKWFKERPDTTKRKANISRADIYINPPLEDYGIKDYDAVKIEEMIEIGYNACLDGNIAEQLKKLKTR